MPLLPFPPGLVFLLAALIIPLLRGRARSAFILAVPVLVFGQLLGLEPGQHLGFELLGRYQLELLEVGPMRLAFAYVFVIIALVASIYALHEERAGQHSAAFVYVGASLGVVFAGDWLTLFVSWEIMAVASATIILLRRSRAARAAAYRYLLVHVAGGALLMAGIILQVHATGSLVVQTPEPGAGYWLVLLGFALNAAVPPLSAWLSDAYAEASITGAVYLTAYTTKTAVFTLALVFPGAPVLAVAGAVMALYGALFAFMENDIRRLLAYHIISQVGYMVCGVGIGSELALNGATAHAFSHILYKATLFMGAGAVIYATGRRQLTELGGIWKRMPLVTVLFMIAAFSISGVPLWNGFISKSMIISAASEGHLPSLELALTLASVGTTLHTMLKLPWFTFFGEDRGLEVRPLPRGMLVAMGIGAGLCTLFGVWPDLLYRLLPHPVDYHPYTRDHVVGALQLILATGLAFFLFLRYFTGHHAFTRDTDTLYRGAGRLLKGLSTGPLEAFGAWKGALAEQVVVQASGYAHHPERLGDLPALRPLARWLDRSQLRASAGAGAAVAMLALGAFLLLYYLG